MFIIHIPELNTHEYIEFYNLSGTCELKTKLRIKSYDKILRYLRKQNIQDADNITALLDYKTGAHISESPNIAQYTQFTIIRHPLRKLIMDLNLYSDRNNLVYPPYRYEDRILCDDRDFVVKFLNIKHEHSTRIFTLKISNRLNSDKKVVKTLLKIEQWGYNYEDEDFNKMATEMFNKIDYKFIGNKEFILELMYLNHLYEYLPYELQIDIDIICHIWHYYVNDPNNNYSSDICYDFLINTVHPDGLTSDVIRRCNIQDTYLVHIYQYISPTKLDKDIWTKIIHGIHKMGNIEYLGHITRSIYESGCMTSDEFMQILSNL